MRFGIVEEGSNVICVGCDEVISTDGKITQNYCSKCGNPLSLEAIKNTENKILKIEKQVLYTLKEISENKNTDSFKSIVKTYMEEN